jgi:hypothetical protein
MTHRDATGSIIGHTTVLVETTDEVIARIIAKRNEEIRRFTYESATPSVAQWDGSK